MGRQENGYSVSDECLAKKLLNDTFEIVHRSTKITSLLGNAVVIILSATALYISYMLVGIDSIGGMQGRSLVVIIHPTLYSLGIGGTTHRISHNTFVCIPILIVASVFICDIFKLCILQYWRTKMKRG